MTIIEAPFDVSPRIIKILGEELIHDKKIAISELVKNAYDADATLVQIKIADNQITIKDNGHGMNANIIKNYWLKPGSSGKRDNYERTPKFERLPLGEKGVGRLGVHRLGKHICVISKAENSTEVLFEINWDELENQESLKDINPISIENKDTPMEFTKGSTGTKLIIKELREIFQDKDISNLQKDLLKLLSPFKSDKNKDFRLELHTTTGLFAEEKQLDLKDVLGNAFFEFDIHFDGISINEFTYKCLSPNENKYPSATVSLDDSKVKENIARMWEEECKKYEENHPNDISLGEITFKGYIFEPKLSKLFKSPLGKDTTEYLKENGGIRVYRDGIRVYNYGEGGKDNDILDLDRKRAKKLGDNIGYNQLLAAIDINGESSKVLTEKTNREGFIHNKYFAYLQKMLDFCMEVVMYYRKLDKAEMKFLEGKEYDRADITSKIEKIVYNINKLPIDTKEKQKINNDLYDFSNEFKEIKNIFLTASNTGLNLTFMVHEIDKIIDHLGETIKNGELDKIKRVFAHLQESISAYKQTIKLDKKGSAIAVSLIIKQSLFNSEYRFNCHEIKIVNQAEQEFNLIVKKGLIIGTLNNLFDNSIYWLGVYNIEKKKILIKTYSQNNQYVLIVADNGKGFNVSFEASLRPFVSGRLDDSSMGIGLHLASQVMEAHQGSIEHGDWQEEHLSEEFSKGAIVKLIFPKEIK